MRISSKTLGVMLVLWFLATNCWSQDPNVELMKKLYTKIGQTVGVGSNDITTGESFLVLAGTGILLDPNINYSTIDGRYLLSRAIDKVPTNNWIYGIRNTTTLDVYNRILQDHEAAEVHPTAAQIAQYKAACAIIFTDCDQTLPGTSTAAWTKYQDATKALAAITKQAEDYRNNNQTDYLPPDLANELQIATDNLDLMANRAKIEGAKATINTYEHIDPNTWWGEVLGRFQKNSETRGGNRFGNYNLYPSYPVWLDMNRSWTKLALTQNDLEVTTNDTRTSVGGGASFNLGLWSVGADYSDVQKRSYYKLDGKNYAVTMELMRVTLDRPWMDEMVYESHAWKWLQASPYDKKKIASGADAASGKTPPDTDIMPFLPSGLLLARRVSLSADWQSDLKTSFEQHTSAGGSVGWGPISFGGWYVYDHAETYHKANAAGNTISWDDPQIIGFFVEVLPNNPDPDRCYHFPSDTQPLPADCTNLHGLYNYNLYSPSIGISSDTLLDRSKQLLRRSHTYNATHQ